METKSDKRAVKPWDKRLGNQFWKIRSKHGRDKLFASADLLWDAAYKNFDEWLSL